VTGEDPTIGPVLTWDGHERRSYGHCPDVTDLFLLAIIAFK